jgi:hypothetical protein
VESCDGGQNSGARVLLKETILRRVMRADQRRRVTPAGAAFVKNYQFRMKIVGERNREEQQNQSAGECSPFTQRIAAIFGPLAQPSRPPKPEGYDANGDPQKIEKKFHDFFYLYLDALSASPVSPQQSNLQFNLLCNGFAVQTIGPRVA